MKVNGQRTASGFRQRKLAAAVAWAVAGGLLAAPAAAQDLRVDVTGSSIRRVEVEGALPITTITRADIELLAPISTDQLLQQVSAISTMGGTQLSFGAGNSTYGQSSISMRGLGSERTLVLVNGRRISPFPGDDGVSVNVNTIPLAAIERIEVLRDGASAVYGSDAVAGVVNFILRKDYDGIEVGVNYGGPTRDGGGESLTLSAVGGFGNLAKDRYNFTGSFSYQKERAVFAKDRDFAATGNNFPFTVAGATGQGNIEGGFTPGTGSAANGTWREGTRQPGFGNSPFSGYGNPRAAQNNCEAINMFRNPGATSRGYPYCAFDSSAFVGLLPDRESLSVSGSFEFMVTKDITWFNDFLYSLQTVTQEIQTSPVRRSFMTSDALFQQQGIDPALLIYPSNPNYQIAADYLRSIGQGALVGQPLAITARVFDFGPRTSQDEAQQWRFVTGLRGSFGKHDWEVAYSHNDSQVEGGVIAGYFSQTAYAQFVQGRNDWNPWSLTQTPSFAQGVRAAEYIGPTLDAKGKSDSIDGKITGEIWNLPAGPLLYAAGAGARTEELVTAPSPALGTGDIAGLGGSVPPVNRDRDVWNVFAEFSIPIVKTLEATAAVRNDHYSDFGNATTYFGSLRWQPHKSVLLRTAYGTGFRAPTLIDLYQPQVVQTSEQFNDPVTGQANLQVPALTGGNPLLQPEESKQWTIGVLWQPVRQVSIGLDWFNIKMKDLIQDPSAQEVVSGFRRGDPAYRNLVTLSPSGDIEEIVQVTSNTGDAEVQGIDIDLSYRDTFSWGTVGARLQGTWMDKFTQTSPGGFVSQKVGTIVEADGSPVLDAQNGGVVLEWKHILSLSYGYGPWSATLVQNWYNGYETGNMQLAPFDRVFIDDQQIYDLHFTYTGVKNLTIGFGAKNIFDKNPPLFIPVSNQFQAGYDVSLYDPRSRFLYMSLNYKFK